jgi:hypothetical protein
LVDAVEGRQVEVGRGVVDRPVGEVRAEEGVGDEGGEGEGEGGVSAWVGLELWIVTQHVVIMGEKHDNTLTSFAFNNISNTSPSSGSPLLGNGYFPCTLLAYGVPALPRS